MINNIHFPPQIKLGVDNIKLIIAEKPSVAQTIAKVLGVTDRKDGYFSNSEYYVSWCVGHLVGAVFPHMYDDKYKSWNLEDLPIIPDTWQYEVPKNKQKQFTVLKKLMNDKEVTELVCATDAGREGEAIFRFVYEKSGCKKPFQRLWISSMEDVAIREGFENLKDSTEYDNLYASALCRSKADWLVGINATRLFTVLYNHKLNVGRVQSPTLAMLVERAAKTRDFEKENYYHARIDCVGFEATGERLKEKSEAEQIRTACHNRKAVVVSVERANKVVNPPKLYDLTTLQREANRLYGYTAQQTLDLVQALYEKKLCTYPRTDSQFLTDDMADTALGVVDIVLGKFDFAKDLEFTYNLDRVIDNSKVSDHHAIIPTVELKNADLGTIPESERKILSLISCKLLCAIAEQHVFETVTATIKCSGFSFTAKGKNILSGGWKTIENRFKRMMKTDKEDSDAKKNLPPLTEGQTVDSVSAFVTDHTTSPPKPYTEDTLLSAMETAGQLEAAHTSDYTGDTPIKCGLGTPATRASVIEKLISSGFVERKKKQLLPTENGIKLITVLPERLKSPSLTAEWENALSLIAKGDLSPEIFMSDTENMVKELCINHQADDDKKDLFKQEKESVGICPRCGGTVIEGKKNFYCQGSECQFVMWKEDHFFTNKKKLLTKDIATALLKDRKINIKGLYSEKSGKTYDATVVLADTGEKYVNYRLNFGN